MHGLGDPGKGRQDHDIVGNLTATACKLSPRCQNLADACIDGAVAAEVFVASGHVLQKCVCLYVCMSVLQCMEAAALPCCVAVVESTHILIMTTTLWSRAC